MKSIYPIIKDNFEIHITGDECYLFNIVKDENISKRNLGLKEYNQWQISRVLVEYIRLCNGENSHEDITKKLKIPFEFIGDSILSSLKDETKCIEVKENKSKTKSISITGDYDGYFPLHMSIEITDNCNFRCKHCYISASPDKKACITLENFKNIADLLKDNGVKIVEITGGEATIHKDFKEIIKYSCEKFNMVALITNGFVLGNDNDLCNYLSGFNNLCVQISLDGKESFHDAFRNMKGSYKAACMAAKKLKENGTMVRIAMSITEDNVNDVEFVLKKAKELKVDSFATTVISEFGRGADTKICPNKNKELNDRISKNLAYYVDDPLFDAAKIAFKDMLKDREINCGAGWRSFALNGALGDIRSCLFLPSLFRIGNLYEDEYKEVFSKDKLDKFRYAPSPSHLLDTCKGCEKIHKCNGCMAQGLKVSENGQYDCKWYDKYIKN